MDAKLLGIDRARTGRRTLPSVDGYLCVQSPGAGRLPGKRSRRFRETRHPQGDRGAARQCLHFRRATGKTSGRSARFYEANLDLTNLDPQYSFLKRNAPIYTHPRFLPGSKINGATLRQAIISDGCIISDAHIERSVIGVRSIIRSGATIRNSVIMGGDYFEALAPQQSPDLPPIGIGRNCVIDRAIIDKNARIGDGVVITPEGKQANLDADNYFIRDGIVVVPKDADHSRRVLDLAAEEFTNDLVASRQPRLVLKPGLATRSSTNSSQATGRFARFPLCGLVPGNARLVLRIRIVDQGRFGRLLGCRSRNSGQQRLRG